MTLTPEQKQFILDHYQEVGNLTQLTRLCFGNDEVDGRTREGRAVRAFLVDHRLEFSTSRHEKSDTVIELTDEQKRFCEQYAEDGLSSFRIAEILFPDQEVKKLGHEQRTVLAYLRTVNPDFSSEGLEGQLNCYSPPKAISRLIKKVLEASGTELEEKKLTRQQTICLNKLAINLANSRFQKIINNYEKDERKIFEDEFVRLTWDKPDLTADEVNLYMNVCKEVITLEVISRHLKKLNGIFDDTDGQNDLTVRLAETIKSKSNEYHQCSSRIETLTKKLQGDRAERMKSRMQANASILSVIQAFQDEEERKNIARIAELQRLAVEKEVDRFENMDEWRARILGIAKEDVI